MKIECKLSIFIILILFFSGNAKANDTLAVKDYLKYATVFLNKGDYQKSREHALKAIDSNPQCGQAFILIGSIYIKSVELCSNDTYTKGIIMCLAVDQFEKAITVDSTVKEIGNKMINIYSDYFPSRESIPFGAPNEGHKYKIDCWIDRETIVRYRD